MEELHDEVKCGAQKFSNCHTKAMSTSKSSASTLLAQVRRRLIRGKNGGDWLVPANYDGGQRVVLFQSVCRRYAVEAGRCNQSDQHGLDADCGFPRVWDAGRLHDVGGWLLPLARNGQCAHGMHS